MDNRQKNKSLVWFPLLILAFLLAGGTAFHITTFHPYHNWGPDFAKYIGQAVSLVDGLSFLDLFTEAGQYPGFPWGFPILLAPVYYFRGLDLIAFKITVTLFYIAALPVIFFLFRKRLSAISRYLIIAIFLTSPWLFYFKNNILSDFPYLFFSMVSILMIQEFILGRKYLINPWFSYLLTGFFIGFTMLIRTQGVVLLPTLLIFQIYSQGAELPHLPKKGRRLLKESLPLATAVILYLAVTFVLPQGNQEYWKLFLENLHVKSILLNMKYYLLLPGDFFGGSDIQAVTYGMTIPLFLYGLITQYKKDLLYVTYSLISIALLIFWPYQQGIRFIISLLPFYFYFVFLALENIRFPDVARNTARILKITIPLLVGIWIIFVMWLDLKYFYETLDTRLVDGPYTQPSQQVLEYLKEDTPADAVIMFRRPPVISLYARRKTISEAEDLDTLLSSQADYYLFYSRFSNQDLLDAVQADKQDFTLDYYNDDYLLYRILH